MGFDCVDTVESEWQSWVVDNTGLLALSQVFNAKVVPIKQLQ